MLHLVDAGRVLASFVESVAAVCDEARCQVTGAGIAVRAVDTTNAFLVSTSLAGDRFTEFTGTECEICLDIARLDQILKKLRGMPVTLRYSESTRDLRIAAGAFEFAMPTLDTAALRPTPNFPALDCPASVVVPGSVLATAVRVVADVSPVVTFAARPKTPPVFEVFVRDDTGKVARATYPDGDAGVAVATTVDAESRFSVDFVNDLLRRLAESPAVRIDLGVDMPIRFSGLAPGAVPVTYIVAPRIGA